MRAEKVTSALLNVAAITALVGNRIALTRLPENTPYPAIVYEGISGTPILPITANAGGSLMRTRMQITAMSRSIGEVKNILEQVRIALSYQSGLINGVQVVAVVPDMMGPDQKNDEAAVFMQSRDFLITYYET